jgi:heme oxygenase
MSVIDLSLPLSDVLREGTKQAHEEVEVSPAASAMLRGALDKEEYIRFLMMLWHIYATFERGLERHQNYPVLEPTYNPTLLARAPPLSADIAYLLGVPESSWKSHRIHVQLMAAQPPALETYTTRIQSIADSPDPSALLAHSYVRYLGDLSGGQTIQRALAKAYGLTMGGSGLSFYAFKELHSSKPATQGEMKRIKEWFRAGMNKGAGDNVEVKAAVMEEASRVFEFTGEIFKAVNLEKEESKVVYDGDADAQAPRMYSIASVSAVVIAVCVAHFFLTVGGFTGERGYEKLMAVEEWLSGNK